MMTPTPEQIEAVESALRALLKDVPPPPESSSAEAPSPSAYPWTEADEAALVAGLAYIFGGTALLDAARSAASSLEREEALDAVPPPPIG